MSIITKDLLLNFLFIVLILFIVQLFYLALYSYRFGKIEKVEKWILPVSTFLLIYICMQFPVLVGGNIVWDIRWIPMILGGLYGGYRLGFSLVALILILRYFIGTDTGFYVACIIFPFMGIVTSLLSRYYLKMSIKHKVIVSVLLLFLAIPLTMIIYQLMLGKSVSLIFWLQYGLINIMAMLFTNLLVETMKTHYDILKAVIRVDKLQMVSHLAASISHEVRNPLTASRGFIQMLSEDVSEEDRRRYRDIALQELDRATEVINDYLTFAKPTIDYTEKIKVSEEIEHAINVITPLATMKDVMIKQYVSSPDYDYVKGMSKRFQQCLINILKNAIEALPSGGELQINQSCYDAIIQIDIRDNGIGMSKEQIQRLGEPYFTTKERGTGLGMMVSFSIIKAMNGKVHVTSELGKGTCFSIKLPINNE